MLEKKVVVSKKFSWRIIFGTAFLLLLITSFLSSTKAEELITTPLEELLPPEDLPTGDYPWAVYAWDFSGTVNATLNAPGFVEGRKATYYQSLYQVSEKVMYFFVYRFVDGNSAKTYHDDQVDALRASMQGLNAAELSIPGAFAVLYEYDLEEEAVSLGYISNIVFKVYYYNDYRRGFWVFPSDSLKHAVYELPFFTNLQTSIIPEFPTLIIFSLFMMATLFAVIAHKRKHL